MADLGSAWGVVRGLMDIEVRVGLLVESESHQER